MWSSRELSVRNLLPGIGMAIGILIGMPMGIVGGIVGAFAGWGIGRGVVSVLEDSGQARESNTRQNQ